MFGSGVFGSSNEPQSAAFGPQKHRKLFFNPETREWEAIGPEQEAAYDKAYASNTAAGRFKTLGSVANDPMSRDPFFRNYVPRSIAALDNGGGYF